MAGPCFIWNPASTPIGRARRRCSHGARRSWPLQQSCGRARRASRQPLCPRRRVFCNASGSPAGAIEAAGRCIHAKLLVQAVELDPAKLKPWTQLATDIPQRVEALKAHLLAHQPRLAALFVDCGDTLVDERTEVKLDGSEVVVTGELIPGSDLVLAKLKRMGHTLVLVADGPVATFENMLKPRGMWEHFSDHIISERVGVHKPDPAMFRQALAAIGLDESRAAETAMVGNNLSRDILGANRMGIASIFMKWSTLRTHIPESREEVPDFTISFIDDLPDLVDRIDTALALGTRSVT